MPGVTPGVFMKRGADALEDAIWSARRDTDDGYGIGVFDLDPGQPGGKTTITMRYYHAWAPIIRRHPTTSCSTPSCWPSSGAIDTPQHRSGRARLALRTCMTR